MAVYKQQVSVLDLAIHGDGFFVVEEGVEMELHIHVQETFTLDV